MGKGGGVFVGALGTSGKGVAVGIRRRVGVTVIALSAPQALIRIERVMIQNFFIALIISSVANLPYYAKLPSV